ncbi:sulfite exporter TauE/SafE family protein [uncultured Pseudokineococcus sp.]|uniref:sulfite exporter TauE/SafE family protein n=1 Tax=uncultured Pseudokineococcus sp. TaxID=1642928 RepID=UPI002624953F|nr:sulfite exporter TauE/SafE family protein [uncultured Pseudokineococcus sp.]
MRGWIVLALVGLAAQLVDGSLGMAYGVTSTTLLIASGTSPALASASVHLAEIGTTLASGASHWRFGNVDWRIVGRLAVPGAVGSFLGATALSSLSTEAAAPYMAGVLLALGVYVGVRFTTGSLVRRPGRLRSRFLVPVGLFGGFLDASGGGGWGPVATPALLGSGRVEPRKVVGSVDTSEFVVAVAASLGFLLGLGTAGLDLVVVSALLVGGVVAAPVAAWVVRYLPARVLGAAVGGVIVVTNVRTLLRAFDVEGSAGVWVYPLLALLWAGAVVYAVRRHRRERALGQDAGWGPGEGSGEDEGERELTAARS